MKMMGARPPPPSSLTLKVVERQKSAPAAPPGGFWTNRGLPGFKLTVPQHKIKQPRSASTPPSRLAAVPEGVPSAPPSAPATEDDPVLNEDPMSWGAKAAINGLRRAGSDQQLVIACLSRLRRLCRVEAERTLATSLGAFEAIIESLRPHCALVTGKASEEVAEAGCAALRVLSTADSQSPQKSGDRDGAVIAVVEAMTAHPTATAVAEHACFLLWSVCFGGGDDAVRRKELAIQHGAASAVTAAMRLRSPSPSHLLRESSRALQHLSTGTDSGAVERRRQLQASGALPSIARMLNDLPSLVEVVEEGCVALVAVCTSADDDRLYAAYEADVISAVSRGMEGCRPSTEVQQWGCRSIELLTGGDGPRAAQRRAMAADTGAITAVLAALGAHPSSASVQVRHCRLCA